uniref:Bardet-Biedl syndrome 10 n=1 Tax=Oryzias latipes TaxID=8090 RepID=A0A3P9K2R1_ORYLA
MPPSERLPLEQVLEIVSALEAVVLRSFGPEGGQVLFTRDTGQAMLSRSGACILSALHLEHPLARVVVESVWKHSRGTGDGSKTFILLLASLLRGISIATSRGPSASHTYGFTEAAKAAAAPYFANKLLKLVSSDLDDLIAVNVVPYGFCVSLEDFTTHSGRLLLASFFHTRVSHVHCSYLSELTCEMLNRWKDKSDLPYISFQFLRDSFPALHTPVSGFPVSSSRLIEGQVIHRDFATPCLPITPESSIVHFSAWTERSLESVIAELQSLGVSLLLSAVKQSDAAVALATQAHMSLVECVSEEELSLFVQLSGVTPVSRGCTIQLEHVALLFFFCETTASRGTLQSDKGTASLDMSPTAQSTANKPYGLKKCVFEPGCVIPAGGTFEFLLCRALPNPSSDTNGLPSVTQLLANALLSVPRQIYSHSPKLFLQAQTRIMSLVQNPSNPFSLGLKESTPGPMVDLGLESVPCKYRLILAVVQCATSVVRVDTVLHTRTALHTQSKKHTIFFRASTEDEAED